MEGAHKNTPVPILPWRCKLRKTGKIIRFSFAFDVFPWGSKQSTLLAQYHISSVWQLSDPTDSPIRWLHCGTRSFRLTMQRFLSFPRHFILPGLVFGVILATSSMSRAQLPMESNAQQSAGQMAQNVAELQKVADRWDEAVYQHDQYALELVLAPQFIDISDTGEVANRDQQISEMMMKDAPRFQLTQKVVSVRMVGDVAVVNGTYQRLFQGSKLSRTKSKTESGVFSQVYVRARSSWECMNSQRTIIQEPIVKGKKKAAEESNEKPLNHDLGFHFPGMHHSSDSDSSTGANSTTGTTSGSNSTAQPQQ
jgi:hypothetical protein